MELCQDSSWQINQCMQSSLILGGRELLGGPECGGTGLGAPIWLQLSRAAAGDKSGNMSVSVEAENQAPNLHDLVTKRDQNEFVWDHQFTVTKMHNNLMRMPTYIEFIDHEMTISI